MDLVGGYFCQKALSSSPHFPRSRSSRVLHFEVSEESQAQLPPGTLLYGGCETFWVIFALRSTPCHSTPGICCVAPQCPESDAHSAFLLSLTTPKVMRDPPGCSRSRQPPLAAVGAQGLSHAPAITVNQGRARPGALAFSLPAPGSCVIRAPRPQKEGNSLSHSWLPGGLREAASSPMSLCPLSHAFQSCPAGLTMQNHFCKLSSD